MQNDEKCCTFCKKYRQDKESATTSYFDTFD